MVGLRTLTPPTGVRIPLPQPNEKARFCGLFFWLGERDDVRVKRERPAGVRIGLSRFESIPPGTDNPSPLQLVNNLSIHDRHLNFGFVNVVSVDRENILIENNEVSFFANFERSNLVFKVQLIGRVDRESPDQ